MKMKLPETFKEIGNQAFRESDALIGGGHVIDLDSKKVIIDYRLFAPHNPYSDRVSVVLWIRDDKSNRFCWATGTTAGHGYHHESAAISNAMRNMGIVFDKNEDPDSRGTEAQEAALDNLAHTLGYTNTLVVPFHP
jgi:hypothetical protein